jgi:two-component system sensor histidine kinase KdpD
MAEAARWVVSAAAVAAIVAVYYLWLHVNPTTVSLTLLLVILLLAVNWGLRYAVAASLGATVCFNYYFLPPIRTFTVADPQNWVALLAFLITAIVASRLSSRIREETHAAMTRQREVEMLFHLSRELLQTDKVAELIDAVPRSIARVARASAVLLFVEDGSRVHCVGEWLPEMPTGEWLRELMLLPAAASLGDGNEMAVPLRVGARPRGLLLLAGVQLSTETFEAMAGLVSIAIDRAQALEDVTLSETAKQSERLRRVMLDSITHELRTPLTAIKASVTTLLSAGALPAEDSFELLTIVDEESDRLNRLLTQSIEMAQLDAKEVHMRLSAHRVAGLLDGLAEACGPLVAGRQLLVELEPALPRMQADPEWIRKVLRNLVENAAKYSPRDAPITVGARRVGASVEVSVADRGFGIDSAEQRMIFEKFYRGRTQVERVPGTGMGLAICRAILEAHGGSIRVESQPGIGSVFTFSLPVSHPTRET